MSVLSKLKLSASTPNEPITPLARKRLKLIAKLDQQIAAAEAEARDEEFVEQVRKWVRDEETGQNVWSPNNLRFANGGGRTPMASRWFRCVMAIG